MQPPPPAAFQVVTLLLGLLGELGVLACCGLPLWRRTVASGRGLLLRQWTVEGLWASCVLPSPGKANCRQMLTAHGGEIPLDVYASRLLTLTCLLLGLLALILHCLGSGCLRWGPSPVHRPRLLAATAFLYLVASLSMLLAVSWPAFQLATDYQHPLLSEQLEVSLGPCIYLGWANGGVLLLAGMLLGCWGCRAGGSAAAASSHGGRKGGKWSDDAGSNFL
ncbi:claudin i [Mobula birostris]|uniref:claudin i n=1 Tax=Mobula birostris TaxID=1983395 RepID=UPI003B283D32